MRVSDELLDDIVLRGVYVSPEGYKNVVYDLIETRRLYHELSAVCSGKDIRIADLEGALEKAKAIMTTQETQLKEARTLAASIAQKYAPLVAAEMAKDLKADIEKRQEREIFQSDVPCSKKRAKKSKRRSTLGTLKARKRRSR